MEDFNKVDTTAVQAQSLNRFMEGLGYKASFTKREDGALGRLQYVTDDPELQMMKVIGFDTAVRLHNMGPEGWIEFAPGWLRVFEIPGLQFAMHAFELEVLYARRIVTNVKWQKNKRATGGIRIMSQMVKVASPRYLSALGLDA